MNENLKKKIHESKHRDYVPLDIYFSAETVHNISREELDQKSNNKNKGGIIIEKYNVHDCSVMLSMRPMSKMLNEDSLTSIIYDENICD